MFNTVELDMIQVVLFSGDGILNEQSNITRSKRPIATVVSTEGIGC